MGGGEGERRLVYESWAVRYIFGSKGMVASCGSWKFWEDTNLSSIWRLCAVWIVSCIRRVAISFVSQSRW